MADPLPWPSVLMPSSEDWSLRGGTRSGGQTFQGNEQIIASPTARWKATLSIPCFKKAQILAMRRVIAMGRSQRWFVGPYERGRAPWPNDPIVGGTITDRTPGAPQPALQFALSEAALLNAVQIAIQRNAGNFLSPGMLLSIGGWMHVLADLVTADPVAPGSGQAAPGAIALTIRPWTRVAYAAGTPVEFASPVTVMRLASDDTGAMELQLSRYGTVTLDLVEAL
jgi:hypothetical protein